MSAATLLSAYHRLPAVARGMLMMFVTTLCFAAMQSMIKWLAASGDAPLHPFEIAFFRNLFGVVAMLPMVFGRGITQALSAMRTTRPGLHLLRAVVQAVGMLSFFVAVTMVPLAEVTSLSFSAPLFATTIAVLLMGERIRARRITALALGFAGVLIVLQPGMSEISVGAILAIVSSLCWGFAMTVIKTLSRTDSPLTITLYAGLLLAVFTAVPAAFVWTTPTLEQLSWLLGIGVVGTIGHLAFAQSLRVAEMSAVLPLDFLRLVWASAIGFVVFQETPTLISWAGGALIFGSATYIALREAQLARHRKRHGAGQ
ncbi:MAG: DMT family transporter [Pseudomonadota bacterium]